MATKRLLILCGALLVSGSVARMSGNRAGAQEAVKTLRVFGLTWEVRATGSGGPGPNQWNPNNVRVDKAGRLHLKITRAAGKTTSVPARWECAELTSKETFGMGRYQFQVIGRIDRLDRNVVLGLFDYPTPEVGGDGTNEIDIEFARWGNPKWPNGNYTVYPAAGKIAPDASHTFDFKLGDADPSASAYTTHNFIREPDKVTLQSLAGPRTDADGKNEIAYWTFAPSDKRAVPQQRLPVHLNLWLFHGAPPSDSKEVEIVITSFSFTPAK